MATPCRSPGSRASPALAVSTSDTAPLARAARSVNPSATAVAAASYATIAASASAWPPSPYASIACGEISWETTTTGPWARPGTTGVPLQRGGWTGGRRCR